MSEQALEYVGFWPRVGASLIDTVLVLMVTYPILYAIYGGSVLSGGLHIPRSVGFLLDWVFPAVAIILFWIKRQATPGKDAISAKIVDAKTGAAPTVSQLVVRYLGYYVSTIPLGLGLIWVAFDARKQGWHDKMAGTVVVRKTKGKNKVFFERA